MTKRWGELTEFRRDCLRAVRRLELHREDPVTGQAIKRDLQRRYDESVNHGRLYPNLDHLIDEGLLGKEMLDGRTNTYALSARGRELLERELAEFAEDVGIGDSSQTPDRPAEVEVEL